MKISLIISFYKRLDFLELILMSLLNQEYKNFEVIIAEDDNADETKKFLCDITKKLPFKLLHVYQKKDEGFRKNEMLNKAIWVANGELIIIIDGDCILHKAFFKEYIKAIKPKAVLFGRRALLSESFTKKLLLLKNLNKLNVLNLIFSGSSRIEDVLYLPGIPGYLRKKRNKGVQGSNMGFLKTDILSINGFDEDYQRATAGEDDDIEWRFRALGFEFISMKNKALQYHLYHRFNYSQKDTDYNLDIINKKRDKGIIFCLNGISKYAENPIKEFAEY
ncbi:MAG TPA: glycosyltransferase [Puia sp.]|nr:glycosyltransferase [Puia sp.]